MELLRIKAKPRGLRMYWRYMFKLEPSGRYSTFTNTSFKASKGNPDLSIGIYNRVIHISLLQKWDIRDIV